MGSGLARSKSTKRMLIKNPVAPRKSKKKTQTLNVMAVKLIFQALLPMKDYMI